MVAKSERQQSPATGVMRDPFTFSVTVLTRGMRAAQPPDAAPPLERGGAALRQDDYRKEVDSAPAERSGPPQYQRRDSIRSPRVHVADAAR